MKTKSKRTLTDRFVRTVQPGPVRSLVWDKAQGGLALSIEPSGHRAWKAVYRHGGRVRWYTLGAYPRLGLKEAREACRSIMARVALGEDPQGDKIASREGESFNELTDRFIKALKQTNKSWSQTDYLIRRHLRPAWGGRKARDVGHDEIRRVFNKIADTRPVLANQTLAAASSLFSWAVEDRAVGVNPCLQIKRRKTAERDRVLTEDELRRLWPALDELGLLGGSLLKVMLLTAQRIGEVRGMAWSEIDGRWWTIPKERTKNKKSHRVYLSDMAKTILDELDDGNTEGFVFPSPKKPDKPITPPRSALVMAFAKVKDFRPHDLRRTAASYMTALGIPRLTVSKVLNHSEAGLTRIYDRHSYDPEKARAMETWAARLDEIVTGHTAPAKVVRLRT